MSNSDLWMNLTSAVEALLDLGEDGDDIVAEVEDIIDAYLSDKE